MNINNFMSLTNIIASISSSVIGLAGFGLTIWYLKKTKSLAENARDTAKGVRDDIKKVDTITDLSSAITIMEEIKRLQREGAWYILPDRYTILRQLLIRIKSSKLDLSDSSHIVIQNSIAHIKGIENDIENRIQRGDKLSDSVRLNKVVTKEIDKLQEVLEEVKSSMSQEAKYG